MSLKGRSKTRNDCIQHSIRKRKQSSTVRVALVHRRPRGCFSTWASQMSRFTIRHGRDTATLLARLPITSRFSMWGCSIRAYRRCRGPGQPARKGTGRSESAKIIRNVRSLVFFAGHGMEAAEGNVLAPVDASEYCFSLSSAISHSNVFRLIASSRAISTSCLPAHERRSAPTTRVRRA
jgi:hypothetical protein